LLNPFCLFAALLSKKATAGLPKGKPAVSQNLQFDSLQIFPRQQVSRKNRPTRRTVKRYALSSTVSRRSGVYFASALGKNSRQSHFQKNPFQNPAFLPGFLALSPGGSLLLSLRQFLKL